MTRFLSTILLLFAAGCATVQDNAKAPKNAISTIQVKMECGKTLGFAANDLKECLSRVTGREFTLAAKGETAVPSVILRLADESLGLAKDEWMMHPVGNDYVIEGGAETGVVGGIYDFLERFANCLWLDLDTTVIHQDTDFAFPTETVRVRPAIYAREVYTGMNRDKDGPLKLRNLENTWNSTDFPAMSVDFGSPRANHTMAHYAKGWTKEEWFALNRSGKRSKNCYCLSNPDVRQAVAEKLKEYIRNDRASGNYCEFYDISQNDTGGGLECVCPDCQAIRDREGAYSGVLCEFLNAVSAKIRDEFPDITITTLAYNYTLDPPKQLVLADNILVRMCGIGCWAPFTPDSHFGKKLEGWKRCAKSTGIWDYAKKYEALQWPYIYKLEELPQAIRNCRDYNARHYFFEYEDPLNRSFAQLQWWVMLRFAVNPDRDFNEMADKFIAGYYGPSAAPLMREYLDYLLRRQKETGSKKGIDRIHTVACYLDDVFYSTVNSLLDRAEKLAAGNPLHLLHVRRERIPVDIAFHTLMPATPEYRDARRKAFARYAANVIETSDACPRMADWQKKATRDKMELYAKLEELLPLPVPEQFKGREIVDVVWKDFTRYGTQMKSISPDAKAVGGMTWGKPRPDDAEPFSYPVSFVLTDFTNREFAKASFSREQLPPDGEYHWIHIGSMDLPNVNGLLTAPHFEAMLWKGGIGIIPKPWQVHAHIRVSGPDFGAPANAPNAIFCDRIIFANAQ